MRTDTGTGVCEFEPEPSSECVRVCKLVSRRWSQAVRGIGVLRVSVKLGYSEDIRVKNGRLGERYTTRGKVGR